MEQRKLGPELTVSAIGLGCMGMSAWYGETDEQESIRAIHRAPEIGINFLDTAELYGPYENEKLVGKAIAGRRDDYVIATKFGVRYDGAVGAADARVLDGSPENVRRSIEGSLERLGTDHVDLYYQHRMDPTVPIEETVGALAGLVEEGKVRYLGLSEAGPKTIRRAHAVHPIAAVQSEYSLWSRDIEDAVVPTLRELGIGLVSYSPLGRGFLTGRFEKPEDLDADDFRRSDAQPRFADENFDQNLELVAKVREIAEEKDVTAAQLALAWVLARGEEIVPIPGTKRRSYLEQNAEAAALGLSSDDLARIDAELPEPAGTRYDEASMAGLYR